MQRQEEQNDILVLLCRAREHPAEQGGGRGAPSWAQGTAGLVALQLPAAWRVFLERLKGKLGK